MWLNSDRQPVTLYLTTVTYSFTCMPFLALQSLHQLNKDEGSRFPKVVVPMTRGRYVDDIFGEADTIPEARDIAKQVTQLCLASC